jgi:hypothetical protein
MCDYCIEMGFYFDEQGKLRRRVARDRDAGSSSLLRSMVTLPMQPH